MIKKIKGIIDVESRVAEFIEHSKDGTLAAKENRKAVQAMQKEMDSLREALSTIVSASETTHEQLASDMQTLKSLKDELKSEIMDFKLLKTTLKEKLVEGLLNEFRAELDTHTGRLKTDVQQFNELKAHVETIAREIGDAKKELAKFNTIASKLKSTDFELTGYVKKITQLDHEKVRLMKKVDELQRLIGKERRARR